MSCYPNTRACPSDGTLPRTLPQTLSKWPGINKDCGKGHETRAIGPASNSTIEPRGITWSRPACWGLVLILLAVGVQSPGHAQALSDAALARISFEQKLNAQVSLDLPFRDESGQAVRLGDYFGRKPVILVLGYYQCPMLCTLVANGMIESLEDVKWSIGHEFDVVHVSIDPRETPELAAAKKRNYLKRYGRSGAAQGWHFLTGQDAAIKRLADEVGFQYAYDAPSHQYAHASGLIILTPQGKVARYLFGVTYSPADLFQALAVASANKVGSPVQRLILLCFHYNPIRSRRCR